MRADARRQRGGRQHARAPASSKRRRCWASCRALAPALARRGAASCPTSRPGGAARSASATRCVERLDEHGDRAAPSADACRASRPPRPLLGAIFGADDRARADRGDRATRRRLSSARRWCSSRRRPSGDDGRLAPRPFTLARLRRRAPPTAGSVMPGGFCRISDAPDARAVSMGEGVRSADVWVLGDKPVEHGHAACRRARPCSVRRHHGHAAEPRRRQSLLARPLSRARRGDASPDPLPLRPVD